MRVQACHRTRAFLKCEIIIRQPTDFGCVGVTKALDTNEDELDDASITVKAEVIDVFDDGSEMGCNRRANHNWRQASSAR